MEGGLIYCLTRYILESDDQKLDIDLVDEILETLNYIFEQFCSDDSTFTFKKDCMINEQLKDKANYLFMNVPRHDDDFECKIIQTLERFLNLL